MIKREFVVRRKTKSVSIETDKNEGENANDFVPIKCEQILTERQNSDIISGICALCPFPKALSKELNKEKE